MKKQFLQYLFKEHRFRAKFQNFLRDFVHLVDVHLRKRSNLPAHLRMRGNKHLRPHCLHHLQSIQVSGNIIDKCDLIFLQRLLACETICKKNDAVAALISHHIEKVAVQRNDLNFSWQRLLRQFIRLALLRQQKFMPQALRWKPAIEKRRFQDRVLRKSPLNSRRKYVAPGLRLQVVIAADMIRIGMRIIDCLEPPVVGIQYLAHFSSRFLVVSTVDEANVVSANLDEPDLCRTLDIVTVLADLLQFVHVFAPVCFSVESRSLVCASNTRRAQTKWIFHRFKEQSHQNRIALSSSQ
ncbi:hypothetical protein SDC9_146484 [bioreactor metagenome]|uniref:Uncharacterized protein n=1 Tax=bioreactor metagenome TaxID=1076179 RepID=A0A645EEU8_9ZZZZ